VQAVEREMAPKLAAFNDRITQNEKLFRRIAAVYEAREAAGLDPEQKRLAWLYYTEFVRAGARLDAPAKKRLSEINQRLATLFTQFSQNVLADETDYVLVLESAADLAGLPPTLRAAASAAAESRGHQGKWAILNTRSSMEPFLTYSDRRDLREKVWRTYFSRGDNGDARQQRRHHRDPHAARRAGETDRLSDPRPPPARELDGEDAGAHARAHGGGVEAGGGARPRRGRRHAEARELSDAGRAGDHD
jgi:peptidyl-dipeptidase Dcp